MISLEELNQVFQSTSTEGRKRYSQNLKDMVLEALNYYQVIDIARATKLAPSTIRKWNTKHNLPSSPEFISIEDEMTESSPPNNSSFIHDIVIKTEHGITISIGKYPSCKLANLSLLCTGVK